MKCKQIKLRLPDYVAGCLAQEQAEISSHLETCAECRRETGRAKEVYALLKANEIPAPHEDFWPEFAGQTISRIRQTPSRWWDKIGIYLRPWHMAYGLGLAGCAALIAAIFILSFNRKSGNAGTEYMSEAYLFPAASEELLYQLGDEELDDVCQNLNARIAPASEEFITKRNGTYDLLYQLNGNQLDYLKGQLQQLTYSKPEGEDEVS